MTSQPDKGEPMDDWAADDDAHMDGHARMVLGPSCYEPKPSAQGEREKGQELPYAGDEVIRQMEEEIAEITYFNANTRAQKRISELQAALKQKETELQTVLQRETALQARFDKFRDESQ